jgi:type III pantothenate kinase
MGAMSFGLLTTLIEREIPLVYYVVDDWLVYGRKVDPWTRLFRGSETLGRLVRRAVGIPTVTGDFSDSGFFCFVSAVTRERTERFTGWRFERNTIVPCGVSRAFEPGSARKEWGWRLYLPTRIDPRKGIATAIAALAELPHAHLVVQGRGDDSHLAELRELALSTGVSGRVEFAPFAQHSGGGSATVAAGYNGADACLFPPTWEEPFGMVPLEAMASGTPVIASGVGGSAEFLVDGENCLLFTPGDPSSLAGAVDRLASDAALRQRLVEGGLATAERFRVEHTADRLEGYVLDEIAAKVGQ